MQMTLLLLKLERKRQVFVGKVLQTVFCSEILWVFLSFKTFNSPNHPLQLALYGFCLAFRFQFRLNISKCRKSEPYFLFQIFWPQDVCRVESTVSPGVLQHAELMVRNLISWMSSSWYKNNAAIRTQISWRSKYFKSLQFLAALLNARNGNKKAELNSW